MAFQTVDWVSSSLLPCAHCLPAKVILCLPEDYVVSETCPLPPDTVPQVTNVSTYKVKTIKAELLAVQKFRSPCSGVFYRYSFVYEGSLIETGKTVTAGAIHGVICDGCLTQYIDDRVGNEISLSLEDNVYTLTTQHGCQYQFPGAGTEHTSIATSFRTDTLISLIGAGTAQTMEDIDILVVNPSTARNLRGIITASMQLDIIPTPNGSPYQVGAGFTIVRVSGSPNLIANFGGASFKEQSLLVTPQSSPNMGDNISASMVFELAPAGSMTVRMRVSSAVPTLNMSLADIASRVINVFGSTV